MDQGSAILCHLFLCSMLSWKQFSHKTVKLQGERKGILFVSKCQHREIKLDEIFKLRSIILSIKNVNRTDFNFHLSHSAYRKLKSSTLSNKNFC